MGSKTATFVDATFTASNGVEVKPAENGGVEITDGHWRDYTPPAAASALQEFFESRGAAA